MVTMSYAWMVDYMGLPVTDHNLYTLGRFVLDNQGERAMHFPDAYPEFSSDEEEEAFWDGDWSRERYASHGWDYYDDDGNVVSA